MVTVYTIFQLNILRHRPTQLVDHTVLRDGEYPAEFFTWEVKAIAINRGYVRVQKLRDITGHTAATKWVAKT